MRANFISSYVKRQKKKKACILPSSSPRPDCLRNWDSKGKYHVLNVPNFEKAELPESWIQQAGSDVVQARKMGLETYVQKSSSLSWELSQEKWGKNVKDKCQWPQTLKREIKMSEDQDKGMEKKAAVWIWSQGLKGMSRQREYMSMPGGLSLDIAPQETVPGFPQLHLQPSWSLPPPPTSIPLLGPGLLGTWNSVLFTVTLPLLTPQYLVQCLTLRRHKINAQQMKR